MVLLRKPSAPSSDSQQKHCNGIRKLQALPLILILAIIFKRKQLS